MLGECIQSLLMGRSWQSSLSKVPPHSGEASPATCPMPCRAGCSWGFTGTAANPVDPAVEHRIPEIRGLAGTSCPPRLGQGGRRGLGQPRSPTGLRPRHGRKIGVAEAQIDRDRDELEGIARKRGRKARPEADDEHVDVSLALATVPAPRNRQMDCAWDSKCPCLVGTMRAKADAYSRLRNFSRPPQHSPSPVSRASEPL